MNARIFLWLSLPCALAACVGPLVPIQTAETAGVDVADRAARITIASVGQAASLQALGEVVGNSCKNQLWSPTATSEDATAQVKLVAAQRGATAISAPVCEKGGFSLRTNCWQSFTCTAQAYK